MALKPDVSVSLTRRAALQTLLAFTGAGLLTAILPGAKFSRAQAAGRSASLSLNARALTLGGKRIVLETASD